MRVSLIGEKTHPLFVFKSCGRSDFPIIPFTTLSNLGFPHELSSNLGLHISKLPKRPRNNFSYQITKSEGKKHFRSYCKVEKFVIPLPFVTWFSSYFRVHRKFVFNKIFFPEWSGNEWKWNEENTLPRSIGSWYQVYKG